MFDLPLMTVLQPSVIYSTDFGISTEAIMRSMPDAIVYLNKIVSVRNRPIRGGLTVLLLTIK